MGGAADLRAALNDALVEGTPPDAQMLNMVCFWVARSLDELEFSNERAAALARTMLRVAGRVIIDSGTAGADPSDWDNTQVMALEWIEEAVKPFGYSVVPTGGRRGGNQPP